MTHQPDTVTPNPRRRTVPVGVVIGAALFLGCFGVLYGMREMSKEAAEEGVCPGTAAAVAQLSPLVHGEVAALALRETGRAVPALAFTDADGHPRTMADFKGRTVLLNLWATWCIPCRKEMPALDRLQAKLGGSAFQVVAVNVDTAHLDRPKTFLHDVGVSSLPFYADASAAVLQRLKAFGLPTTLLVDKSGCELGVMAGPAQWDSPDAQALIEAAKQS